MKSLRIRNREIIQLLDVEMAVFPKYASQLINLANQNAQGTRPEVVGQMSELIQEFRGRKLQEWEEWYLNRHPEAIEKAKKRISLMIENFRQVITEIDEAMITSWVKDLVIVKTFVGLKFQEAILKRVAECLNKPYRLAEPVEESKGIDGFIGDRPVSIKPQSYSSKQMLPETIDAQMIFYDKTDSGVIIFFDE